MKTRRQLIKEQTLAIAEPADNTRLVPRQLLDKLVEAISEQPVKTMTWNARDRWEASVCRSLNVLAKLGLVDVARIRAMQEPVAINAGDDFDGPAPKRKARKPKKAKDDHQLQEVDYDD